MGLISVRTNVPGLSVPMVQITHPTGVYPVAQFLASNTVWKQTARYVIGKSGTGDAYAVLQRKRNPRGTRGRWTLEQKGSASDIATLVGRDKMPKNGMDQHLREVEWPVFNGVKI